MYNIAAGCFANEGKLLFDAKYLRDLAYDFDPVGACTVADTTLSYCLLIRYLGHLPSWLNSQAFPPSYFHNVIATSSPEGPVIYMDLSPFGSQVQQSLNLCQDKVLVTNAQGTYQVTK